MPPAIAATLWRRLDVPGHDACRLVRAPRGWLIEGAAVFLHAGGPAAIAYGVCCDLDWTTTGGHLRGHVGGRSVAHEFTRRGSAWHLDGVVVPHLDHLDDLDFSITPATNFLQVRRLRDAPSPPTPLHAAWFDLDVGTLTELPQVYTPRGGGAFWYEAPTVGYAASLEVGRNGFIQHYPGLWRSEPGPAR